MDINVILATNRLQIETFDGDNLFSSVTYINIVAVSRGEDVTRLVTAPTPSGDPTTTTTQDDFIVRLHLADQKHVDIPLAYVANQPGWTNDQAGYEQAEIDIYAAFPTGGGSGSGTVTSVGFNAGTTGFGQAVGPITGSGTFLLTGYAAVRTGNTLWVDRVYGDNATAQRNRQNLPYETVMDALAAASDGDLIHVRAGTSAEVIDDSSAPSTAHIYFEPGATAESISIAASGGWTITGGTLDEDITFSLNTGEILVLQTVTMRNLNATAFNAIVARECNLTGNTTATNGGSIEFRNCIITANTTADGGVITSYNTAHRTDAIVQNGGVLQGYDSSIGGLVTADPVTGDFFDGVVGADGDTQVLGADGRWSWGGPSEYVALLTQSGTDAPVATVLKNTLGGTVVWSYAGVGVYEGTLAGAFPISQCVGWTGANDFNAVDTSQAQPRVVRVDNDTIRITSVDGDGIMTGTPLIIQRYQ